MYLGLDCSTQSLSALIIDAAEGILVHEASVNFEADLPHYHTRHGFVRGTEPDEFFSNPLMWLEALDLLLEKLVSEGAPLAQVKAISGSGQQHATVYLNKHFHQALQSLDSKGSLVDQLDGIFTRPVSPIWLDSSTVADCHEIAEAIGGHEVAIKKTGSSVTPRFSAAQIHKHARQFPKHWHATDCVHLVSSFLASILSGRSVSIDYGDGAGMNLMNLSGLCWDGQMAKATAAGTIDRLPDLCSTAKVTGAIAPYFSQKYGFQKSVKCAHWSGDNPCSLVGMGVVRPGTWVISLGTSFTLFSALEQPHTDPAGYGHVFGNPIGGYMALSCFKNGALACVALKDQLALSWDAFEQLLSEGSCEAPILPYFETEITPAAAAVSHQDIHPRELIDSQFLAMRHHTAWHGELPETILVTGGISRSDQVCQTIANIFQRPVQRLSTSSSAALGAAMIAAHADGHDIDLLSELYCQPEKGSTIEPDPNSFEHYSKLKTAYTKLLSKHVTSPPKPTN